MKATSEFFEITAASCGKRPHVKGVAAELVEAGKRTVNGGRSPTPARTRVGADLGRLADEESK